MSVTLHQELQERTATGQEGLVWLTSTSKNHTYFVPGSTQERPKLQSKFARRRGPQVLEFITYCSVVLVLQHSTAQLFIITHGPLREALVYLLGNKRLLHCSKMCNRFDWWQYIV